MSPGSDHPSDPVQGKIGNVTIYEAWPGMYQFKHLPHFARHLLEHHVDEFSSLRYALSVQYKLPLLQHLSQYDADKLALMTRQSSLELLTELAQNRGEEYISLSVQRWLSNELQVLHYYDVVVEDITVLNFVRAEAFRQFIPGFTSDTKVTLELAGEIDRLFMGYTTSSMITFIRLLQARLSRQETQLLEAESIAQLGSFDWNIHNHETESSPEMRQIMDSEEPMGIEYFLEHVHPDDSHLLHDAIAVAFVSGKLECEFRFLRNHMEKTLWARGLVHFDAEGPRRMVGVVQDITTRKQMEATLLHKTLELERSNEELQQFASVASHDLNEPLRKIVLYTGLLEAAELSCLDPDARRNLQRIKDAARRMRLLIDDILAFSSLNQQQEAQPTDLEKLLYEVLELVESRVRESGAHIFSDGLPKAMVVPFQFRQLFQNLLSNSLKFAKAGVPPEIKITHRFVQADVLNDQRFQAGRQYLQLIFADNGIGFPAQYAEKIFGLFNRLHNRTQFEGTGLGLAIVRKVAENHAGRIEAESQPGQGATFTITIPQSLLSGKSIVDLQ
jgi:signal transduction histidine kinase